MAPTLRIRRRRSAPGRRPAAPLLAFASMMILASASKFGASAARLAFRPPHPNKTIRALAFASSSSSRPRNRRCLVGSGAGRQRVRSLKGASSKVATARRDEETDDRCSASASSSLPPPVRGIPKFGLAGVDLASEWARLVEGGHVQATAPLQPVEGDDGAEEEEGGGPPVAVRYGVRVAERTDSRGAAVRRCEEFAVQVGGEGESREEGRDDAEMHPRIARINATLASIQSAPDGEDDHDAACPAVQCGSDPLGFAAQLQLVRTLRPPPSRGFEDGADDNFRTTCVPPPYDPARDSFLVGPLRLRNRPLVAALDVPGLSTPWDVYHNISPVDARGHYLLLPTLSSASNWRDQSLNAEDCADLVRLASTAHPAGSALVSFNSVGAGASQNHVHCHLWPCPPPPLLRMAGGRRVVDGWECYPASRAGTSVDGDGRERTLALPVPSKAAGGGGGEVRVSMLDFPCCCVKVSAVQSDEETLSLAGRVLSAIVSHVQALGAPHNLGLLNRPPTPLQPSSPESPPSPMSSPSQSLSSPLSDVDAYLFVRSGERSPRIIPDQTLGSSETMGVFHAYTVEQMEELMGETTTTMTTTTEEGGDSSGDIPGREETNQSEEREGVVDAYLFVRSRERSPRIALAHKLGSSEVMGAFHAQSNEQMGDLLGPMEEGSGSWVDARGETKTETPMYRALRDVSYEREDELWLQVESLLGRIF